MPFHVSNLWTNLTGYEVDGLERVNKPLPLEVQYACKFWESHISCVEAGDQTVVEALEKFFKMSVLWWLEVRSLTGKSLTVPFSIQEPHCWAVHHLLYCI